MHWSVFALLAGGLNALNNLGYKHYARKPALPLFMGMVLGTAAIGLLAYATLWQGVGWAVVNNSKTFALAALMGIGTPIWLALMLKAFATKGPLSLVDPLWLCIYALVSYLIGTLMLDETPSLTALIGIGLFLLGAFLMAKEGR